MILGCLEGRRKMGLPSTLICLLLLLMLNLVFGNFLSHERRSRGPRRGEPERRLEALRGNRDRRQPRSLVSQNIKECQEGSPLGSGYSGKVNVTESGRTCQVWSAQKPHEHVTGYELGEHNYCRYPKAVYPYGFEGVWCYTTDPDKKWEHCAVPICTSNAKVFDFSADNDQEPDSNGEFTSAILDAGPLPDSFTICLAFQVDAWTTVFAGARMFEILPRRVNNILESSAWASIQIYTGPGFTEYAAWCSLESYFVKEAATVLPLQWTLACLTLDSNASKVVAVVDGQLMGETEYKREGDRDRPANLSVRVGFEHLSEQEYTGRVANLNVFDYSLPVERMVEWTRKGGDECAAPGNLVSWEEAEWTLYSRAQFIEMEDLDWERPCQRLSQVQLFTADFQKQRDCMDHCQKISDGRSSPVNTEEEWESLTVDVDLITRDRANLPIMWLSATEGDAWEEGKGDYKVGRLPHWPETELVRNETRRLEAKETVWRDFYSGQRLLDNWAKPWSFLERKDELFGEDSNCVTSITTYSWHLSWMEFPCYMYDMSCPCSYPSQPLLRLRGLCSEDLIDTHYGLKQPTLAV